MPSIISITERVSPPGGVAGHEATCSCGLRITSSLKTMLLVEISQHLNWHAKQSV